jgi:hypothetical protein
MLPSKCESLSSNPSNAKKKKDERHLTGDELGTTGAGGSRKALSSVFCSVENRVQLERAETVLIREAGH